MEETDTGTVPRAETWERPLKELPWVMLMEILCCTELYERVRLLRYLLNGVAEYRLGAESVWDLAAVYGLEYFWSSFSTTYGSFVRLIDWLIGWMLDFLLLFLRLLSAVVLPRLLINNASAADSIRRNCSACFRPQPWVGIWNVIIFFL